MRKLISLMHISLDGFAAGPHGELEWALVDDEMYDHVAKHFRTVDTAIYGPITYQMMEGYWPTVPANPDSNERELVHSRWVDQVAKVVFSTTLPAVTWNNTRLVKDQIAEEIRALKQQEGGDLMIFGSPRLTHTFQQLGEIDEYVLSINPVVLGGGIPLFQNVRDTIALKLLETTPFQSGAVGLHYRVEKP